MTLTQVFALTAFLLGLGLGGALAVLILVLRQR